MNIIDQNKLLSVAEEQHLMQCAAIQYRFEKFGSLDDILTQLGVDVCVEPGVVNFSLPESMEKALEYWRIKKDRYMVRNDITKVRDASIKIEEIETQMKRLREMLVRGLYLPAEKRIVLYPEEMKMEYDGLRMNELLLTTLAHETMHAYFDRPGHEKFGYNVFIEEPLAEFGMLLYVDSAVPNYFQWAYADVSGKYTCYRFGAVLFDQCKAEGGFSPTRDYLEEYKVSVPVDFVSWKLGRGQTFKLPNPERRTLRRQFIYSINGKGHYKMHEVVAEYVRYRLDKGDTFADILNDIEGAWNVGKGFVSDNPDGVRPCWVNVGPYSFSYKSTDYYITKEVDDGHPNYNFYRFRVAVNATEPDFQIVRNVPVDAPVTIGGRTVRPKWRDAVSFLPQYFVDGATRTLGLDGHWDMMEYELSVMGVHVYMSEKPSYKVCFERPIYRDVYLGDKFSIDLSDHASADSLLDIFQRIPVTVSPNNTSYMDVDGIPMYKMDGSYHVLLPEEEPGVYKVLRDGVWKLIDDKLQVIGSCD